MSEVALGTWDIALDNRTYFITMIWRNCPGESDFVLCGITIGEGAEIGVGAVVTKDIPANSVAVGSPARVIREVRRDPDVDPNHFFFNKRASQQDLEQYRRNK